MGRCRCCRRYGIDTFGILFAIISLAVAVTNQVILYLANVAFLEVTFLAGAGMCFLSFMLLLWSIIQTIRTCRRYRMDYAEWNATDMEEYVVENPYTAYSVPQEDIERAPRYK